MKHCLLILTWSLIPLFAYSQDILITREGDVIEAFNLFEKDNSIFYSHSVSQDSTFHRVDKSKLLMIKYRDGRKMLFNVQETHDSLNIDTGYNHIQKDRVTRLPITCRKKRTTHAEAKKRIKVLHPYIELQYRRAIYSSDIENKLSQLNAPALTLRTQYIGQEENWFLEYVCGLQYAFGNEKEIDGSIISVKNFSAIEAVHAGPYFSINRHQRLSFYGGLGLRTSLMWNIGGVDMQSTMASIDWKRFIWVFEAGAFFIHGKTIMGGSFGIDLNAQELNTNLRSFSFCFNLGFEI